MFADAGRSAEKSPAGGGPAGNDTYGRGRPGSRAARLRSALRRPAKPNLPFGACGHPRNLSPWRRADESHASGRDLDLCHGVSVCLTCDRTPLAGRDRKRASELRGHELRQQNVTLG